MKNILVTGVSRGLGLAIAENLLRKGWQVFGVHRSLPPALQELQEKYSQQLHVCQFDLSDTDSVKKSLFRDFIDLDTPLHGLVNNAAMAYDDIITNLKSAPLEQMYRVNVFSPMMIVKYAIRNMIYHRVPGSIVHISSISVHTGYKGLAMYASTKGALEAFSKNTAREWGSRGIRSNCLVAGFMETDMSAGLTAEQRSRIYKRTALKRATEVSSVADTTAYLLDESSSSVTGQNLFVDSGTL